MVVNGTSGCPWRRRGTGQASPGPPFTSERRRSSSALIFSSCGQRIDLRRQGRGHLLAQVHDLELALEVVHAPFEVLEAAEGLVQGLAIHLALDLDARLDGLLRITRAFFFALASLSLLLQLG
jgi:hypothetical protein